MVQNWNTFIKQHREFIALIPSHSFHCICGAAKWGTNGAAMGWVLYQQFWRPSKIHSMILPQSNDSIANSLHSFPPTVFIAFVGSAQWGTNGDGLGFISTLLATIENTLDDPSTIERQHREFVTLIPSHKNNCNRYHARGRFFSL